MLGGKNSCSSMEKDAAIMPGKEKGRGEEKNSNPGIT